MNKLKNTESAQLCMIGVGVGWWKQKDIQRDYNFWADWLNPINTLLTFKLFFWMDHGSWNTADADKSFPIIIILFKFNIYH